MSDMTPTQSIVDPMQIDEGGDIIIISTAWDSGIPGGFIDCRWKKDDRNASREDDDITYVIEDELKRHLNPEEVQGKSNEEIRNEALKFVLSRRYPDGTHIQAELASHDDTLAGWLKATEDQMEAEGLLNPSIPTIVVCAYRSQENKQNFLTCNWKEDNVGYPAIEGYSVENFSNDLGEYLRSTSMETQKSFALFRAYTTLKSFRLVKTQFPGCSFKVMEESEAMQQYLE